MVGSETLGGEPTVDGKRRTTPTRAASRIGRFSVLRRVGAGGMGEVYAAYDDQLDRKVAIKLVASDVSAGSQGRVRREAQAMARVDHDNVLRVYEAGDHDGQTFIAMEFVDGSDLRAWLREAPRSWEEILAVYLQAGAGLAAAHEAGLVHRDFKPDNAMVDAALPLRVRVLDFGLAGRHGEAPEVDTERSDSFSTRLTQTGDIMGTPAYMAPEQIAGTPATAQADQFAYCVSLWEALYGKRPYGEALEVAALFANVLDAKLEPPPSKTNVPAWLIPILQRGLERDPAHRWPSMRELLAELSRDRKAARRRVGLSMVGLVVVGGAMLAGQSLGRSEAQCDDSGDAIESAWNEDRRSEARSAFDNALERPVDGALDRLDDYARAWRAARIAACDDAASGAFSEAMALSRLSCLEERRQRLEALGDALTDSEHAIGFDDAVQSIAGLPRISSCADPDFLAAEVPPPDDPETRRRVETVRATLARIDATAFEGGRDLARKRDGYAAALSEAEAIGYAPLLVECHDRLARTAQRLGEPKVAMKHALAAFELAETAGTRTRSVLLSTLAELHAAEGNVDLALSEARRAVAILERALGSSSLDVMSALQQLAHVHKARGEFDAALEVHERAAAIADSTSEFGDVERASLELDLGQAYDDLGDGDRALVHLGRALELRTAAFGKDSLEVAMVLANRGAALYRTGNPEAAQSDMEASLAIRRARLPGRHPDIADAVDNLATILMGQGELENAAQLYEEALAIREEAFGPEHVEVAYALHNLGALHFQRGRVEASIASLRRAETIRARTLEEGHPLLAGTRRNLAVALHHHGDLEQAKAVATASAPGRGQAALLSRISRDAGDFDEARRYARDAAEASNPPAPRRLEAALAMIDFAARHFERAGPSLTKLAGLTDGSRYDRAILAAACAISNHRIGNREAALEAQAQLAAVAERDNPLVDLVAAEIEGRMPAEDLPDRLRADAQWMFVALAESDP